MAAEAGPRTYGQDLELLRDLLRTQGTARRKQYLRNFLRDQDGFARGIWREAVRNHPDISDDAFLEKFFLTFEQHRRKGLNVVAVARDDATWYGPYGPHSHEPELSTVSEDKVQLFLALHPCLATPISQFNASPKPSKVSRVLHGLNPKGSDAVITKSSTSVYAHETKLYAENDVKLDVKLDDPMDDGDVEGKDAAEEDPVRSELGNADSISPSDAGAFDAGDQKEIYYHGQEDEVGLRQRIAHDEQGEIESQYHEEVENQDQGEVENQDHGEIENQDLEKEAQNLDQQGDQEDIQDRESQEKIFDTSSTAKEEMDYAQVQGSASDHDREELELSEADAVGQEPKGRNELPEEGPVLSKDAEVSEEAHSTSPKNEGNEGETEHSARVEIAESQELRDQQDQQLKVDAMNETNSNCLDHVEDTEGEAQKDTDAEISADGVESIDGGAAISATMQQVEIENNDKSALANEATEMGACEAELDENALTHPVPETGGLDEIETSAVIDVKSTEAAMESASEGGQTEDPLAKQATVVESSIERESGSALHAETHDAVSEAVQGNEGKENENEESKVHVGEDASESSPMGGQDPATMEVIDGTSFDNGVTNDMHRSVVADTNDAQELQIAAGDVSTQPADDATDKGALRKEDGADDATSTAGKNEEEGEQNFASEESVVADPNEEPPAHRERSSEAVQADHSTIEETKDQGAELKKYEEEAGVYAVTDEVAEKNCPDNDDARVAEGENSESSFPQVSADVEVLKDPKETKQDIISPSEGAPADMAGSAEDCEFANALADVDSVETPPEVQNVEKGIPSEMKAEADFEGEEYVEVECKDEDGVTTHGDDADAALTVSAAQAKEEVGIATKESVLEPTTAPEDETDGCKAEEAFEPQTDSPADYSVSAEEDGAYAIENLAGEQQEYEQLEEEAKTGQEYRAASAATERAPTEAIEKPQSAPDYAPPRSQEGIRVDKAANDGLYQWYEVYDEGSGYMYYQHAVTGETQWEPPAEGYVPYQYPEDEAYDGGAGEDAQQEIGAGEEGWAADGTLASEGDQREDEAVEPQRPTRASFYSIDM
ncbi:Hypothetical Protein FCC1311_107912 [Hondaea fermentalgiana]|uniref:WW domain-containing protein n=1 Tax=Hondaea fermentalgiana TaxID=2315210 RepID=A0A2R5GUP1_9STRA|nr:Hypothetical Protein FCC1311_107912 [Hondaea fermentalgiana]|eukprot:GBG34570.1 Hypothetical Protein FCC1311_107912 [Hondaea fermentalgiana]